MRPMDFCQYLIDSGKLPAAESERLLRMVRKSRPQLGRLLIQQGHMDLKQVMQVIYLQADEPQTRFGDLAVRCGYLTRPQLMHALLEQQRMARHPAELLHEEGALPQDDLSRVLIGYVRALEAELAHLSYQQG